MDQKNSIESGEQSREARPVIKWILALLVLALAGFIYHYLVTHKVIATRQERVLLVPSVEVMPVTKMNHQVQISAHGQVEPVTMTQLVSEVSGAVERVSPKLKKGGYFSKGETLVQVNPVDYNVQLEQNKVAVADAELQIAQEVARAEQALRDWQRLGRGGEPGALVRREPQLKSAYSRLSAAQALMRKAERDLEKTTISAPYDCWVSTSSVDEGGYLMASGPVAQVYAAGKVQVKLPISLDDMGYLSDPLTGESVTISAEIGSKTKTWDGRVVRTEGEVDRATHTMKLVVEVAAPKSDASFAVPPVGMFVLGEFEGKLLADSMKLPRVVIQDGDHVWVANQEGQLEVVKVDVERRESNYVLVVAGLENGQRVITSPIEYAIQGMPVKVSQPAEKE